MGFYEDLATVAQDPEVRRLAERRAGSRDLAEDALQETYRAVAQTKSPRSIRDLRAFFCRSLIREIHHQRTRPGLSLNGDIGSVSDRQQGRTFSAQTSASASVESRAALRVLAQRVLVQFDRECDELMSMVPARSSDPRRYRSAIVAAARAIFCLLVDGYATSADWNDVIRAKYPQLCSQPSEPGLARGKRKQAQNSIDQRLSRARRDVQSLLRLTIPPDQLIL